MRFSRFAPRAAVLAIACAHAPAGGEPGIARELDDFHAAAAAADEERYFAHFAPGGGFVGTDATERWDVPSFRAYAHPHFAKGNAWTFRGVRRRIAVRGDVAWFEEDLETQNLGPARGSGVLTWTAGAGGSLSTCCRSPSRTSASATCASCSLLLPAHRLEHHLEVFAVEVRRVAELAGAAQPLAAIDRQAVAGDVSGAVAHEIDGRVRDLARRPEALQR